MQSVLFLSQKKSHPRWKDIAHVPLNLNKFFFSNQLMISWGVLGNNKKVINIDRHIFVVVSLVPHPNVWICF